MSLFNSARDEARVIVANLIVRGSPWNKKYVAARVGVSVRTLNRWITVKGTEIRTPSEVHLRSLRELDRVPPSGVDFTIRWTTEGTGASDTTMHSVPVSVMRQGLTAIREWILDDVANRWAPGYVSLITDTPADTARKESTLLERREKYKAGRSTGFEEQIKRQLRAVALSRGLIR